MKQPVGVRIFGMLFVPFGAYCLVVAVLGVTIKQQEWEWFPQAAVIPLTIGLFSLVTGVGLLMLRVWARRSALLGAGFVLLVQAISVIQDPGFFRSELAEPVHWFVFAGGMVWSGLALWYFLRPGVKAQFISKTTNR